MRNVLKGTLVAGIFLFAWHSVIWMIPGHNSPVNEFLDSQPIVEALEQHAETVPGTYFLNKTSNSSVGEGLWGWMTIHRSEDYSQISAITGSILQQIMIGFVLSWLVTSFPGGPGSRMLVVCAVTLAAAVAGPITFWNWSWFSGSYTLVMTLDLVAGWLLAGRILCWLFRSQGPTE